MTTTAQPPTHDAGSPRQSPPGRLGLALLLGFGLVLSLAGLILAGLAAAAGSGLVAQRDGRFLSAPTQRYAVDSYALTTTNLRVVVDEDLPPAGRSVAEAMVQVTPADPGRPVFVGIAAQSDVAAYLDQVRTSQLTQVRFDPFRPSYRETVGSRTPAPPGQQPFWAVSASGSGTQRIAADLRSGDWVVVVMNADASPGVVADLTVGVRSELLAPVAVSLGAGALLVLTMGVVLLVTGAEGLGRGVDGTTRSIGVDGAPVAYPARLTGTLDPPLSRWLWLFKWLFAVPHYVVLAFLWLALLLTTVAAAITILVTGRYPRSLFAFNVGVVRWSWRVGFYTAFGTDRYPPFTLRRTDYPADFEVDYPERLSRGLVLVKSWLLALPHLLIVSLLTSPVYWVSRGTPTPSVQRDGGISLLGLLVLVAGFSLAFRGRYPKPLFDLVMGINRWVYRVVTYVALMRDEYPPFRLDQGGTEASAPVPPAEGGSPVQVRAT